MEISLLDGSLLVNIFFEQTDREYEDNICICLKENCPQEEKILHAAETNIYLTPEQARKMAQLLSEAAEQSSHASR